MSRKKFDSVWDAIEKTPGEAAHMKLRSALMAELQQRIRDEAWTQSQTARRLGVTQPRVSDLMRGKIDLFSIDKLVDMLAAAGREVEFRTKAA